MSSSREQCSNPFLVNRLNGDCSGPVICQISTDVYSQDHSRVADPAGTRILGETKKVNDVGQERLAVIFHRLIMPDGYAVDLDQAPGLSQIGETALHDKVNNHYFRDLRRFYSGRSDCRTLDDWRKQQRRDRFANVQCQRLPGRCSRKLVTIVSQNSRRFLNILPTITIREGHHVRIFLTQDLMLPAYSNHRMPSDL